MSKPTHRALYSQVKHCIIPKGSLLEKHGAKGAFVDCYQVTRSLGSTPNVKVFADSFYSCNAFYPESWVLWAASRFYKLPPLTEGGQSYGYGFFRVVRVTDTELIMDSGRTQTWMSVERDGDVLNYSFGSILKTTGFLARLLIPPHRWYSKLLLASAVVKYESKKDA